MWMRKLGLEELDLRWPVFYNDTVVKSEEIEKT
jgi:hypothetical protein